MGEEDIKKFGRCFLFEVNKPEPSLLEPTDLSVRLKGNVIKL